MQTKQKEEEKMTKVRITYFGMDGEGSNLTEAKKDAGKKIEAALSGFYTPAILRHGDYAVLVAREPLSGWGYRLIDEETEGYVYLSGSRDSRDSIIKSARIHMAQMAGHYVGLEKYLDDHDKRELDSLYTFHAEYSRLREEGKTDVEAHALACERVI